MLHFVYSFVDYHLYFDIILNYILKSKDNVQFLLFDILFPEKYFKDVEVRFPWVDSVDNALTSSCAHF